jgi:hypothetical protein
MSRAALAVLPSAERSRVIPFDRADRQPTPSEIHAEIAALRQQAVIAQERAIETANAAKRARRALLTVVK